MLARFPRLTEMVPVVRREKREAHLIERRIKNRLRGIESPTLRGLAFRTGAHAHFSVQICVPKLR